MQVSPQTSQPFSRASAIGSADSLAGHVHDVERATGDAGELDRPVRRLALRLWRSRQRVIVRVGVAGRERLFDEHVDRVSVLGVHHHERARPRGDLHRAEERLVVDLERAFVRHEQLVRGDALVGERRELLEASRLGEVGHRDVVAHVDQRLALALAVPVGEGVGKALALRLDAEVDVARGAAERRRLMARADVVDRRGAAERHVEVGVRVDEPGQDELPARVDRRVCADVQVLAEEGDPLAVDEDVADVVVGRRHDTAALDQHGHRGSPFPV